MLVSAPPRQWCEAPGKIKRTAPGTDPKQRPRAQVVPPFAKDEYREDNLYHKAEVARITTEMVRPFVGGDDWGGFGWQQLRIAGLARIIQARLYLHTCSTKYCLQNRSSPAWIHTPILLERCTTLLTNIGLPLECVWLGS